MAKSYSKLRANVNQRLRYVVHGRGCNPRAPKPLKYKFLGVTQPSGVAQPLYSRAHNQTQTCNIFPSFIEIGSETAEKNSAQTNRQTNRHYENNGHLAVNQKYERNFPNSVDRRTSNKSQYKNITTWLHAEVVEWSTVHRHDRRRAIGSNATMYLVWRASHLDDWSPAGAVFTRQGRRVVSRPPVDTTLIVLPVNSAL